MQKKYQCVGVSSPIHDGLAKVNGKHVYAADMQLPGMAYAKLVYSTIPHGEILNIDTQAAQDLAGVLGIFTCMNTPDTKYCRTRVLSSEQTTNQEQLFPARVRFVGERVAMVVAESLQIAEKAARLIKVSYRELPALFEMEDAMADDALLIHEEGNVYDGADFAVGEIPEGCSELETNLLLPRLHHVSLETHGCVAQYQEYPPKLTIWSPCQAVFAVRTGVCEILNMPYHQVRVIKSLMGGSFGCKQETILEPLAALAARELKRPVKLIFSREESVANAVHRAEMKFKIKSMIDDSGRIQAVLVDCLINAGAYLTNSLDYAYAMAEKLARAYNIPCIRFSGKAVCTNTPVAGSYRSWGTGEMVTALEHHLAIAARKLNRDQIDFRLQNILLPYAKNSINNSCLGNSQMQKCLEIGKAKFNWQTEVENCRVFNLNNSRYKRGIGVAIGAHINGFYPDIQEYAIAALRLYEDGTIGANICLHDHGCGTVTAFKKIIAETLELPEDAIMLGEGDTENNYYDYGCYGSRTIFVVGKAAEKACLELKEKILEAVAILWETPVDQLEIAGGFVSLKNDRDKSLSYGQVAQLCQERNLGDLYTVSKHIADSNPAAPGAHFGIVEVDTFSGLVKVLQYLAVHDIGKAINPDICVAQIGGAIQQGIGSAIFEELNIDKLGSFAPNNNLHRYHIANIPEMPEIEVVLVEEGGDNGPYHAKSIGESALVPVVAAVANAVNDALSVEGDVFPLKPERIISLLDAKGGF